MLDLKQLVLVLRWARSQSSKSGSLLERAREVIRLGSEKKYNATVEYTPTWYGTYISHSCGCPAWRSDAPCKHVIALILLDHKDTLSSASAQWREFFRSLPSRSSGSAPLSSGSARSGSTRGRGSSKRISRLEDLENF